MEGGFWMSLIVIVRVCGAILADVELKSVNVIVCPEIIQVGVLNDPTLPDSIAQFVDEVIIVI